MPRSPRRSIRRRLIYTTILTAIASTHAQDLDCSKVLTINELSYNLASLSGEKTLKRTRSTPPTTMEDELRFDVCHDLARRSGVADADQCPTGTRACLTKTNTKSGNDERIIAAIPLAQTSTLQPSLASLQSPAGLAIVLHGGSYPPNASPPTAQSFNLTLWCQRDADSEPTFLSYENGVANVQWNTSAGCSVKRDGSGNDTGDNGGGGKGGNNRSRSTGSGIGWFFLLLFVSFLGYLVLGAYYNYNNFGATGWDLIPHRDFWRDVPYLLRDLTDHLCSTLRPGHSGASRRGYIAV